MCEIEHHSLKDFHKSIENELKQIELHFKEIIQELRFYFRGRLFSFEKMF